MTEPTFEDILGFPEPLTIIQDNSQTVIRMVTFAKELLEAHPVWYLAQTDPFQTATSWEFHRYFQILKLYFARPGDDPSAIPHPYQTWQGGRLQGELEDLLHDLAEGWWPSSVPREEHVHA